MTAPMLWYALAANGAGLCVLPPKQDGSKAPIVSWTEYQDHRSTEAEIRRWYGTNRTGLGVVLGATSGNLELLEFDDLPTYEAFKALAGPAELTDLVERIESGYLEESPNGIHWLYRCDEVAGNTKLARRPKTEEEKKHPNDKVKVLIETRGEGGFAIVAPTHGTVHPSGKPYVLLRGDQKTITNVTASERNLLFDLARTLDLMPRREPKPLLTLVQPAGDDERPGDWYNRTATWQQVLEPQGWTELFTHGDETYWRRPGKNGGQSATTNYQGSDLLYVFTSSTLFDPEEAYTKFAAHAILNHGGDYKAAAVDLARDMPRTNTKSTPTVNTPPDYEYYEEIGEWEAPAADTESAEPQAGEPPPELIMVTGPRPDRNVDQFLEESDEEYDWVIPGLIERQDRVILTGPEGGGKSTFLRQVAVQSSAGIHPFTLDPISPIRVLYIDLENSKRQVRRKIRPLRLQAGDELYADRLRIRVIPQGIDLLRSDHGEWLERRIEANVPDLLIIGPLYKLAATGDPNDEKVARVVAFTLDKLRASYNIALLMEAHVPHATNSRTRPERPAGSSVWMRWPEFGIYLDTTGQVRHWRGQRDEREWPVALKKGGTWPWTPDSNTQNQTFARMMEHVRQVGVFESNRKLAKELGIDDTTVGRAIRANQHQWDDMVRELRYQ